MGAANISILAGGEKPPTKEPPKGKNPSTTREPIQTEERTNLECPEKEIKETTPLNPIEILPYKFTLQRNLAKRNIRKRRNKGKQPPKIGRQKKEHAIKRNGRLPTKRAKRNGGNQTIRYRILFNGYKDAQGTHTQLQETELELHQHEKGNRNYKEKKGRNEQ